MDSPLKRISRQRLGYAAYHWGIFTSPKTSAARSCYSYDVTDGAHPDPVTRVDHNPERNWFFRVRPNVDSMLTSHLLGSMIGKVPNELAHAKIQTHLESIPLPRQGVLPEKLCPLDKQGPAIPKLQQKGLGEQSDIDRFMPDSLAFAD
ncbi:uncharacterized protein BP01DRAFT_343035 [Aspergillus saccharolyticus JOP 1030-1]|uniref:Uncharacterized protein n=1 Tax=Aspergillus saccharolyticus JOP 1030-1 TaxID=1450539 RepID=A0A318ZA26_9EURO|nr:hypothetical protein BP01DRAFT_343035 [Aspergillus saccharolyticus JOP 1030-1]PYH44236.1 hypothetical protein BP01DRAFT_343035 [Aspergillus saccharolyticus JOP 1030-1]